MVSILNLFLAFGVNEFWIACTPLSFQNIVIVDLESHLEVCRLLTLETKL